MIHITDKSKCCGCTACESICPKNAISMEPDELGFKYPVVDPERCIDCGLCEKVCQFHNDYDTTPNFRQPLAYGLRHKNLEEVKTSRSGAAFIAFSDYIMQLGGIVYGAAIQNDLKITHIRATNKAERDRMKGSKYVQSDLAGVFRSVKQDLISGKIVLFSGTPCQTSALRSYIGTRLNENLFLIDIVCHGVPSPAIWKDYIGWLENKWNVKIGSVNFRDKRFGWATHRESYSTNKGLKFCNSYTRAFYKHLMLRDSCGRCVYANTTRPSDITLADFWGWENNVPEWNRDNLGLSLVLINTTKGNTLFEKSLADVDARQFPLKNCLQNQLRHPVRLNAAHKEFKQAYINKGFEKVMRQYGCIGLKYHVYRFLSNCKSKLKSIIK